MSHMFNPDFSRIHKMAACGKDGSDEPEKTRLQFRSSHLNNNLKIDVPVHDQDSGDQLGAPFEFETVQSPLGTVQSPLGTVQSPSVGYDKITKLPTPILANGPFPRSTIEVKKRNERNDRNTTTERPRGESLRIASEFEPDRAFRKRLASIDSMQVSGPPYVRHTSNPDSVGGLGVALPSPTLESEAECLSPQTFHASKLGRTYKFSSIIGNGAFSVVVAASNIEKPDDMVAIKIISVPRDDASNFRGYITRELGILSHLDHPCIVKLLDYNLIMSITQAEINRSFTHSNESAEPEAGRLLDVNDNKQLFYLNFCSGGNLFGWLQHNWLAGKSSYQFWRFLIRIVSEVLVTVAHLHKKLIIHRDIKLENVLINKETSNISDYETDLKWGDEAVSTLTDFGLSKRLESEDQLLTTKCGSQDYVSPELLMGLKYDGKLLDSWSVGVLVYSILENRLPFDPPPASFDNNSGISPSVLRRRRSKNRPAHRIAMVDWEWYRVTQMLKDANLSESAKEIISHLKLLVESLLVRKENRIQVETLLQDDRFSWIQEHLPDALRRVD